MLTLARVERFGLWIRYPASSFHVLFFIHLTHRKIFALASFTSFASLSLSSCFARDYDDDEVFRFDNRFLDGLCHVCWRNGGGRALQQRDDGE